MAGHPGRRADHQRRAEVEQPHRPRRHDGRNVGPGLDRLPGSGRLRQQPRCLPRRRLRRRIRRRHHRPVRLLPARAALLAGESGPILGLGGSDERYHITGGNDQLPQVIADYLPDGTIRQGWSLTAVVHNADGGQTLTFAVDGSGTRTVTADHTILAVPLPVLQQDIDLSRAGLDPRMRGVLAHMTMGYCTKLNMQFTSRPWQGAGPWPGISSSECFSDLPFQQAWDVARGQRGTHGILVRYGGGTPASSLTPPQSFTDASAPYTADLVRIYLGQIDQLWPGTGVAWNGRATLSAWHLDLYTHGAYSYWPVSYLTTYAGYEGTAQGRLHFAGEHTSYDFQGFMEGGAKTGARAAQEVLTAIGARTTA
ncbi:MULTISPECIES: FAD-dependent oxidoreductase [unclassified Kitasatospora]|uniref:flavin monoamine oxidase family protein n=1 Tax=unclassified Kitasatospora TaxID=2633591 RepID=UPI0033FE2833